MQSETQSILDSIRRVVRALRISSRTSEKELGLSSAQLFVLQKLGDGRPVSVNELAAKTLTHQSSVSVVVSKLVTSGLVSRRKSSEDARRMDISITARGLARLKHAPEPAQQRLMKAIEKLPVATRKQLAGALKSVVSDAGFGEGPAPLFFEDLQK